MVYAIVGLYFPWTPLLLGNNHLSSFTLSRSLHICQPTSNNKNHSIISSNCCLVVNINLFYLSIHFFPGEITRLKTKVAISSHYALSGKCTKALSPSGKVYWQCAKNLRPTLCVDYSLENSVLWNETAMLTQAREIIITISHQITRVWDWSLPKYADGTTGYIYIGIKVSILCCCVHHMILLSSFPWH